MTIMSQSTVGDKSQRVDEMGGQLKGLITEAAQGNRAAHQVERALFKSWLPLGLLRLEWFFEVLRPGDEGEQVVLGDGQRLKRSASLQRRRYRSVFGELSVWRWVSWRGEKQRIVPAPRDQRLGLPEGKYSYLLPDWTPRLAVETPFAQVNDALSRMLGLKPSVAALETTNRPMATAVEPCWADPALPEPARVGAGQVTVLSADGKGVAMRTGAGEATPFGSAMSTPGPRAGTKQRARLGAAYSLETWVRTPEAVLEARFRDPSDRAAPGPMPPAANDDRPARPKPTHKQVRAALSAAEVGEPGHASRVIFPGRAEQARQRDPGAPHPGVLIMDGQHRLWDHAKGLRRGDRIEILDLLHATRYLWKTRHRFHPPGSAQALDRMKLATLALLKGQVSTSLAWLTDEAQDQGLNSAQLRQLADVKGYFDYHENRVHYDPYLAAGFPIASGVIGGACRHGVNDRFERTGRRWSLPGAQAMLRLRCVALNEPWDAFRDDYVRRETARLYPNREPTEPTLPELAQKAA